MIVDYRKETRTLGKASPGNYILMEDEDLPKALIETLKRRLSHKIAKHPEYTISCEDVTTPGLKVRVLWDSCKWHCLFSVHHRK